MRLALPLLLIAAAAPLTGCGGAQDPAMNEQQRAAAEQRAPDPEKVMTERWAAMFAHPDAAVAAATDMSYTFDGGYKAAGKGFAATGKSVLPEKPDGVVVETLFEATGPAADKIDTIRFTFDLKHEGKLTNKGHDAYRYVPRLVNGFLARFEVGPGDAINSGLSRLESAKADLHGVSAAVDAQPIKGGDAKDRHITVTFTRVGASAPANQTQGK